MWRWLNANSSAIQALASLAVLLVTAQLARLTGRYVALTKSIADATLEQIRMIKTSADIELSRSKDSLKALAMRTRYSLQTLDKTAPKHRQLAEFSSVAEADVQNIEALAGEIGGSIAQLQAARAAVSVRSILGMRNRAAAVNYSTGWIASEAETKEYASSLQAAEESLKGLEEIAGQSNEASHR